MCEDFNSSHLNHDQKWIYMIDRRDACLACIVENIEAPQVSHLQKIPSVVLLSKMIRTPCFIEDLKSAPNITGHIVHVILEALLHTSDTSFITTATEVLLRLAQKLESEELLGFILQELAVIIEMVNSHVELLPVYVFTGRLLQKFPCLPDQFLQHYENLISRLCEGLCCPEEDVQSAIMFILVYLFEGHWEDHLSPRQLTQLCEDLVCVLNAAKTQILMMNSLGLLTKLLVSDKWVHFMMTLTVGGLTLLSILKKMIASTMEVVQQLAIQIMACIIQKDDSSEYSFLILQTDIVEFLFEKLNTRNTQNIDNIFQCLLPLSHQDQFYSRNHSVYGIEALLKSLHTLRTMNHYVLTKKVVDILYVIFEKQPTNVPLFVSTTTLKLCIDVIQGVIEHNHPGIFLAALKMTKVFLRKDHMLRPIPVTDLKMILQKMMNKVQNFVYETEMFEKQKSGNNVSLISRAYCKAVLAAGNLVLECKSDPSTCLTAFLAPDAVEEKASTVESLKDLVVIMISESAACLAVGLLEDTEHPENCCLLFKLLNCLQKLDIEIYKTSLIQLTQGGVLSKVVSARCALRKCNEEIQHIDPCLMAWFLLLYEEENKDGACPGEIQIVVDNITVKLEDLAGHLTHSSLNKDTVFMYSFLLYYCYKYDHIILPFDELMFVLDTFSKEYDNPADLSPFVRKQFVFLWAILTCMTENIVQLPEKGLQTVLQLVGSCQPSVWYTHHPAVLHWALKDSRVIKICGEHVVIRWLEEISSKEHEDQENQDVSIFCQMFADVEFLSIAVTSLSNMNSRPGKLFVELLEHYLSQILDTDEKGMFLLSLTAITEERVLEIFLHPSQRPEDMNIDLYIQLLIMCDNRNTDDVSSTFLKILYHITSWLDEDKGVSTIVYCLHLLNGAMSFSSARVVNLMVNSYKFMTLLNNLLTANDIQLFTASWSILSLIIKNSSGVDEKTLKTLELSIDPLEDYLLDINRVTPYLQVMSALFQVDFTCPVLSLRKLGRFPQHYACPLTSKEFKALFIYLQQSLLQDINDVKLSAVQCIEDMLKYLKKYSPQLVTEVLRCSWNRLVFEVLITITASDLSSLQTTLQLLDVILEVDEGKTVFKPNSDLHQQLEDFIKCINEEDVTNKDVLYAIRNKI